MIRFNISLLAEPILFPFRIANLMALLIHGAGHALTLALVTRDLRPLCSIPTLLEGWRASELLMTLKPGQPLPQFSDRPPSIPVSPDISALACRWVAIGGILLNLLSLILMGLAWSFLQKSGQISFISQLTLGYFGLASLLAMLSVPDFKAFIQGRADIWACGPAFAIRYRLNDAAESPHRPVSSRLFGLVVRLAREASTRGGQSAGFAILTRRKEAQSIVFDKFVKGKREDIVEVMGEKLTHLIDKAEQEGYSRPEGFEAVLLHLRYATGGATHWHNAQPHWYEHYPAMMHHRVIAGELTTRVGEVFNMIAHNGDMDGVYLPFRIQGQRVRQYFTQPQARSVFMTVMPWTSSQGNSDSRSVAEWVDFVYTQGLAYKSLRYAYFTNVLDFNREIVTGQFNLDLLWSLAEVVDLAMIQARKQNGKACLAVQAASLADHDERLYLSVTAALAQALETVMDDGDARSRFIEAFREAFFHHDLTWVMRQASCDFVGEFALMVCTTLEPRMGVFSLTQAFSLGHNLTRGEIFGSAEPMGVTAALHCGDPDDQAVQIYLEDGQFAIIDYQTMPGTDSIRIHDRASPEDEDRTQSPETGTSAMNWFPVNQNPKISRTRPETDDNAVEKDLREIPYLLQRVVESFRPGGENEPTFQRFADLLFANLLDKDRDNSCYDLVLYGVDFNQDLASEFTLALQSILPGLRIRAENSGNVLKEIKRTRREGIGRYGSRTLFLGLSNSAQTQSTLAVVRKARDQVGVERCFILTQNPLNSMSEALGQSYQPDAPLLSNTFVNLSHLSPDGSCARRRAEAATAVIVATQAVLTEIIMGLMQRAIEAYQRLDRDILLAHADRFALRPDLQMSDLMAFREFQWAVYAVDIPHRVGFDAGGKRIESADTAALDAEAAARAENQIEFIRAYALFAGYIVVATVLGIPLFGVLLSPLSFMTGMKVLASLLDAAFFLSALWLIHLGIRHIQGRPLFERIGARAEVFIDRKYIARIIERYNATLFSNMPAFVTPYFYWADTVQDALHRYGIRAHRGVVTIHRTPDERMGVEEANNAAEENMVYAQLGGIGFNRGQPQSRDKVRERSCYENVAHPYQTVLSDSLTGLRVRHDKKLSPEVFRLINRRLIDLADGLITEFVIGFRRREKVNKAIWEVVSWMPGATTIYRILLLNGIDLKNLAGQADTANQAQIQSTKHPVSPLDIHGETLQPRSTFDALRNEEQSPDQPFAVLVFSHDQLKVSLNRHAMLDMEENRISEITLVPAKDQESGVWVGDSIPVTTGQFRGQLARIEDEDCLVIENPAIRLSMNLPLNSLDSAQRRFLERSTKPSRIRHQAIAA